MSKTNQSQSIKGTQTLTVDMTFFTVSFEKELLGKILTMIDSAITDDRQNKAVKDQIRSAFTEQVNNLLGNAEITPNSES